MVGWVIRQRIWLLSLSIGILLFSLLNLFDLFAFGASPIYVLPAGTRTTIKSLNTVALFSESDVWRTCPITCRYTWLYKGEPWQWEIQVQPSLYNYFKRKLRTLPGASGDYSIFAAYTAEPADDAALQTLAAEIKKATKSENFSVGEEIEFVTGFVAAIPFVEDDVSTGQAEYPRFPVETLVDGAGDCEDKSALLACILDSMGYDVSLLISKNHCAVGLQDPGGLPGESFYDNGERLYFIEATNAGGLGMQPSDFKQNEFQVFPVAKP